MDSDIRNHNYSKEEIDLCFELLEKAKPYSQKEVDAFPFDAPEWSDDRMGAYLAQKILKEIGLLK